MNFFETFQALNQILEVSPELWEMTGTPLRIFVTLDRSEEGVYIDTDKKIISFPVSIRSQPVAANFIFENKAFEMALEGEAPLSLLYEYQKLRAFGDPKTVFCASLFLSRLISIATEENDHISLDVDQTLIH